MLKTISAALLITLAIVAVIALPSIYVGFMSTETLFMVLGVAAFMASLVFMIRSAERDL